MDVQHFDGLLRSLSAGASRRGVLAGVASGLLAVLPLALSGNDAAAKKKKRCKKGKKKKKKQPASPSPPPPLPAGPGHCEFFGGPSFGGNQRWAQTFLPPQGGQLTAAHVFLRQNPTNFALTFEIRTVDGAGVPTSTVLDTAAVINIPQTGSLDPPRQVSTTFASPATLILGQPYALSVTAQTDQYGIHANHGGNPCPDGTLFSDFDATGNFFAASAGNADLVYAVTIA